MYSSTDILEAASTIRPYLAKLVGSTDATALDRNLAQLLDQANADQAVENEIIRCLTSHDITKKWMTDFLKAKQQAEDLRNLSPLPGSSSVVAAAKFFCSHCGYTWLQRNVGVQPTCLTKNPNCALERVS